MKKALIALAALVGLIVVAYVGMRLYYYFTGKLTLVSFDAANARATFLSPFGISRLKLTDARTVGQNGRYHLSLSTVGNSERPVSTAFVTLTDLNRRREHSHTLRLASGETYFQTGELMTADSHLG